MKISQKTGLYGILLGLIMVGLKTMEYKWMVRDIGQNFYVLIIALFFMGLGIWLSVHLMGGRGVDADGAINEAAIKALGLSKRELQVLTQLEQGMTNQQIADALFVSVNTVKTHLKNGFMKLEVNNRMEAIHKLKKLKIIV